MKKIYFIFLFICIIKISAIDNNELKSLNSGVYYINRKENNNVVYFMIIGKSSSSLNADEATALENARMDAARQYAEFLKKIFCTASDEKSYSKMIEKSVKERKIPESASGDYSKLFDLMLDELKRSITLIQVSGLTESGNLTEFRNDRYVSTVSFSADNAFLEMMDKLIDIKTINNGNIKNDHLVSEFNADLKKSLKDNILNKKNY